VASDGITFIPTSIEMRPVADLKRGQIRSPQVRSFCVASAKIAQYYEEHARTLPYRWLLVEELADQCPVSTLACSSIPVRLSRCDHSFTLCRWKGMEPLLPDLDGITSISFLLYSADGIPTSTMSLFYGDTCLENKFKCLKRKKRD
jgi:hypothetical protein